MSKNTSVTVNLDFPKSGPLPVCMTNDLLFHYLLQDPDHADILKGIISSFIDIPFENIKSAIVENPVSIGETITSKMMILDVKTLLNNDQIINLEMQVQNYNDWPERSLSYLCRCFDNLQTGQGYLNVKGVYLIGFLDYTLFPEAPEFYSTYTLRNNKTNVLYTSKFAISVVDLNLINKATDDDIHHNRHLWASFFKAKTWEEISMIAEKDNNIHMAASKLYQLSEDQRIRDEIWAREDFIRCQNDRKNYYESEIATRDATLADKDVVIADKDATIAVKDATIEHLKAMLIANGINPDDNQ